MQGLVPLCPAHFIDDQELAEGLERKGYVDEGCELFDEDGLVPERLMGLPLSKANEEINVMLREEGKLLEILDSIKSVEYEHKISKESIIVRTEPHIYTVVEKQLRKMFLSSLKSSCHVKVGESKNYLDFREMVESKQEWCLTNKSVWGIPIPLFRVTDVAEFRKQQGESSKSKPYLHHLN